MRNILDELISRLERGEAAVLGAVVRSRGSVPRSSGARMLVCEDGSLFGSIGGGVVEGRCRERAVKLLQGKAKFEEADFVTEASDAASAGMVCGGSVSVLLHRVDSGDLETMQRIVNGFRQKERLKLVTVLPQKGLEPVMTIVGDGENTELSSAQIKKVCQKNHREPFLVKAEGRELLVEPLVHPGVVHLVGAGHVALATAHIAAYTGFEVIVMDDRKEFANNERYPDARDVRVLNSFDNCLESLGPGDYVVIVTRGHTHDRDVLAQALRTDAGYIGMIGSSKKRKAVYASLLSDGFNQRDLDRVFSPIGLAIGADTPAEIGLCIVAEMVKVRAGCQ